MPAADAAAEEAQPEPSLAGDAAGGSSNSSDSGTEDKAGAGEVEEEEDLFASGTDEGADDPRTMRLDSRKRTSSHFQTKAGLHLWPLASDPCLAQSLSHPCLALLSVMYR